MLIPSERHTRRDIATWLEWTAAFAVHAESISFRDKVADASRRVAEFAGPVYCGVSWGKDSTVVAHLVATSRADIPLAWIRVEPIKNPHCTLVRDAFRERYPVVNYTEIERHCTWSDNQWHATGTLESGAKECETMLGNRRILGIRAEESGARKLRCMRWGHETVNTLAPLAWWSVEDVFAYLVLHELPIHPVYAMTGNGRWHYSQLRTSSLGGKRGDGMGRAEWEQEYYRDELNRLSRGPR